MIFSENRFPLFRIMPWSERHADQDGLVSLPYIAKVYLARNAVC
jgi:hypothetical protein